MTVVLKDLDLKRVTRDDYSKVMAIRKPEDVYGGNDYLPSCYSRLLASPNCMAFAASLHEKFVAFTIVNIIDGGNTYILRASRVSIDYEGQGLLKWLLERVKQVVMETTSVKYEAYTDVRERSYTNRRLKEGTCYKIVDREMEDFTINQQKLHSAIKTYNCNKYTLNYLNEENLYEILDSEEKCSRLFGNERLVVDWVPYRPIKANVKYMIQETTSVIGSNTDDVDKMLITFSHHFQVISGVLYFIDIYGSLENFSWHLIRHLEQALNSGNENIRVRLFYDKIIEKKCIRKMMEDLNFTKVNLPVSGCLCVEQKVR